MGSQTHTDNASGAAVIKIEQVLETLMECVHHGRPLSIPFARRRRSSSTSTTPTSTTTACITFPGKTPAEAKLFAQVLAVLQLAHQALLAGTYVTKRSIFYQHPTLFRDQRVVDTLVDDLACALRVGRDALHIVAASVGVVAGALSVVRTDGTTVAAAGEHGIAIPPLREVASIDTSACHWILVVEKEATFRTLAATGYGCVDRPSRAGPGAVVTSKGYPTLVTRWFLARIHATCPLLPVYGLVDYDPHGVRILRTYQHGSASLEHEADTTVPGLVWLGMRAADVLCTGGGRGRGAGRGTRYSDMMPLSRNDRRAAVCLLRDIVSADAQRDDGGWEQRREVQVMLMLNSKAEIQAADDGGDLAGWLDERLCAAQAAARI